MFLVDHNGICISVLLRKVLTLKKIPLLPIYHLGGAGGGTGATADGNGWCCPGSFTPIVMLSGCTSGCSAHTFGHNARLRVHSIICDICVYAYRGN